MQVSPSWVILFFFPRLLQWTSWSRNTCVVHPYYFIHHYARSHMTSFSVISDFALEYALKVGVRNLHAPLFSTFCHFTLNSAISWHHSKVIIFFLMVLWIFWCYLRILVFAVKTITIIIFFNTFSPFFMRAWQRYDVICSKLVICLSLIPGIFHVLYIILHTGINRPPAWILVHKGQVISSFSEMSWQLTINGLIATNV